MRHLIAGLGFFAIAAVLSAQDAPAGPRFEVVSIKPHAGPLTAVQPSSPGVLRQTSAAQVLVQYAFDVDSYQVINMPSWGRTDRFDVEAKAESATAADMPAMTRTLLRERFGLRTHRETREGTTYALMLSSEKGQLGPGLKRSKDDCRSKVAPPSNLPAGSIAVFRCGGTDEIARFMARNLDAPVANKTGLSGFWEYVLVYAAEGTALAQGIGTVDTSAPHLATALHEQLGLKLESSRGPIDVLVIDYLERPSAN